MKRRFTYGIKLWINHWLKNGLSSPVFAFDVIRMNVTKRKNSNALLLTKDFYIDEECDYFFLTFDKGETKIGDIINADTDYWYEIVLNPDTNPQTIIGYEMYKETRDPWEKILKLLPEANDDNEGSDNLW